MLTARSSVGAPAPADDGPVSPPSSERASRALFLVIVALALLAVVVTTASLIGQEWHPASDVAVEILRIDEVGGGDTPLTGAHSRYGWDHPGPLLFWVLAPFNWLFGTIGVLVGVAVLNAAAIVGALVIARRRGGLPLAAPAGLVLIALCRETDLLVDPWNPWVAVLPFFTYVLLVWSVAERDYRVLPWLIAVGTFAIQAHLGYAPLVLGAGLAGGLIARLRPARREVRPARRDVLTALLVGGLLWLPPVAQQLFGEQGNIVAIARYVRDPAETPIGWRAAWGIMGTELGFPGAWLTGDELDPFGVRTSSTIPALVLLFVMAGLGIVASRRGHPSAGRLALFVAVVTGLAVVASSRVTGLVGSYLVRWWWVIAVAAWLSILWSISCSLPRARTSQAVGVSVVAGAVFSAVTAAQAVPVRLPNAEDSVTIGELGRDVVDDLDPDSSYLVDWTDGRGWGAVGTGVFLDLDHRGYAVAAAERHAPAIGTHRTARRDDVDGVLLVVDSDVAVDDHPPDADVIAHYDPLTPVERRRARRLEEEIRQRVPSPETWTVEEVDLSYGRDILADAGAPRWALEELADLRTHGPAYTVYLQSGGAGIS